MYPWRPIPLNSFFFPEENKIFFSKTENVSLGWSTSSTSPWTRLPSPRTEFSPGTHVVLLWHVCDVGMEIPQWLSFCFSRLLFWSNWRSFQQGTWAVHDMNSNLDMQLKGRQAFFLPWFHHPRTGGGSREAPSDFHLGIFQEFSHWPLVVTSTAHIHRHTNPQLLSFWLQISDP